MNPVTVWILALMTWGASPEKLSALPQFPGWEESAEDKKTRYESIASDLYSVTYDPKEKPLFGGKLGRARTTALLLSIAFFESGYAKDVDQGPCYRGKDGKGTRCDGGKAACLMQIEVGEGKTTEGWTKADLFSDRKKCFRAALHLVRRSFLACHNLGADHLLDSYAGGMCGLGVKAGSARLQVGRKYFDHDLATRPSEDSPYLLNQVVVKTPAGDEDTSPQLSFRSSRRLLP